MRTGKKDSGRWRKRGKALGQERGQEGGKLKADLDDKEPRRKGNTNG